MSPDRIDIILEIILAASSGRAALTPNQRSALEIFAKVISGAAIDARAGGVGYIMLKPDGGVIRLEPKDVMRRQEQSGYKRD